jgi:hypothetical protein
MSKLPVGRIGAVALAVVALLVVAVAASAKSGTSCTRHAGKTALENNRVRVFESGENAYACLLRGGPVRTVFAVEPNRPGGVDQLELDGPYVGSQVMVDMGVGSSTIELNEVDVATGAHRRVDAVSGSSLSTPRQGFGGFLLNRGGTVVWIVNTQSCSGGTCTVKSTLYAHGVGGARKALAKAKATATGSRPPQPAIGNLAISASGTVAYWTDEGTPKGAQIPK